MQQLQTDTTHDDSRRALLSALAARGVSAQATVVAMRPTGRRAPGRAPAEYEFRLVFRTAAGESIQATVVQFMTPASLDGLAPGEPATILYDRADPSTLVVRRSPHATLAAIAGAAAGAAVAAARRAA